MTTKLTSRCRATDDNEGGTAVCQATFTVQGQRGNQKFLTGGIFTLQADDLSADTYLWEVTSSPPACNYLLTGATQLQAKLSLPGPGAYTVQLTVHKVDCTAQERYILWVATPCRLYRLPAVDEALRFDGDAEWAGDLAQMMQEVDCQLPTPHQKAAMENANAPNAANPFATLNDLPENGVPPVPGIELTEDEIAAIQNGEEPHANNPFITRNFLEKTAPTPTQKAALDKADNPHDENPFVTASRLRRVAPTQEQKDALDAAEVPKHDNPFVTNSYLQKLVLTVKQREAINRAQEPEGEEPFARGGFY